MTDKVRNSFIELRGLRVHNLQNINLDLPLQRLVVVTGVSGAGKSSLAFDTLYAEGQRRYVESFSTYSRRFLERFEKPRADRIEPIPPAVAVRQRSPVRSRRATVGTATEIYDYLRLLFARCGMVECPECRRQVVSHSPAAAQLILEGLPTGTRIMLCFPAEAESDGPTPIDAGAFQQRLARLGFTRLIIGERIVSTGAPAPTSEIGNGALVVVDRLKIGESGSERLGDSLEIACRQGAGRYVALVDAPAPDSRSQAAVAFSGTRVVDGSTYSELSFSMRLTCPRCRREFPEPEPALFNFNSPLGACPECRGAGEVRTNGTIASGDRHGNRLSVAPRFMACPTCAGARLRPDSLVHRVAGRSIADVTRLTAIELLEFVETRRRDNSDDGSRLAKQVCSQTIARLEYLISAGLGYLTLDRPLRSLSTGEAQRVRLTGALGSNLVNMLYILDEPTAGLHPRDAARLLASLMRLRDAGNSVVVVEHDSSVIRRADEVIEIGPGAGRAGGRVVYQGPPELLASAESTTTADFLSGRRQVIPAVTAGPRAPAGWLSLAGVEHHNLRGISVDFPLGVLCVVTGVSGSGKSSLVVDTLYPAVARALAERATTQPAASDQGSLQRELMPSDIGEFESLSGADLIENVLLADPGPVGRSGRGSAAGYMNLFGEIRTLFAGTAEAKARNFSAAHFSFNAAGGGHCETCRGTGFISVDLQFLPDVVMTCPDCHGTRFRPEILEARFRGLTVAEVLALTVSEAFTFFRGRHRLQRRLKMLKDVGLEYITLGQPSDTLSGGESQRLKLAAFLSHGRRTRTLFIIDEPTTGLHPADVARLLDCLAQITSAGHSLIVIEHNLDFIRCADFLIDIGPEAGVAGGQVVATGTPADVAGNPRSITGRVLAGRSQ